MPFVTGGQYTGKVVSSAVAFMSEKVVVMVTIEAETDTGPEATQAFIHITQDSANVANDTLRALGFNSEAEDLKDIEADPNYLNGRAVVRFKMDEYNGKPKVKIYTNQPPPAEKMAQAQEWLRGAAEKRKSGPFAGSPPPRRENRFPGGVARPSENPPEYTQEELDQLHERKSGSGLPF
jgi:hypothetical protein